MTAQPAQLTPQEMEQPNQTPGVLRGKGRRGNTERGTQLLFLRNAKVITGLLILGFFTVIAIIGPWVAPYDPDALGDDIVAPPSAQHWFGTASLGQDIFSQVLVGTRSVMFVGFLAGILATIIAIVVGVTAGYLGGAADEGLSLLSNVFLVLPALPLIIIIAGPLDGAPNLVVAVVIAVTAWAWGARVLRAQTLSHRRRDYVEAARANGESTPRIVLAEILPNLSAIIASSFVGTVTFAILTQVTLAFIGVTGLDQWSWGTVLFNAQSNQALLRGAWWWFVPAGLCIAAVGVALALVNFGIDEFVNPRLRSTGKYARALKKRGVRARVGFTPVDRHSEPQAKEAP
ncbi:ABC transporter permease [Demequina sp.]|uniref:ABC transporter permease n=1 Tax=Demequina sp. TaxID=2050685 RepID=UPI003D0997CE